MAIFHETAPEYPKENLALLRKQKPKFLRNVQNIPCPVSLTLFHKTDKIEAEA